MRVLTQPSLALLTAVLSSSPSLTSALGFSCADIRVDDVHFDLSPLGGVHEIYNATHLDGYTQNTTYLINICNILGGASHFEGAYCGTSKNICGFERTIYDDDEDEDEHPVEVRPLPIAGLDPAGGGSKDPEVTRLKKQDADTEGVRVKIAGGEIHEHGQKKGKPASAVIEFQCDPDRTGLEGLTTEKSEDSDKNKEDKDKDEEESKKRFRREDDEDKDDDEKEGDDEEEEGDDKDKNNSGDKADGEQDTSDRSLQLKSFGLVDDKYYILRLDWKTKYACENYLSDNPSDSNGSGHWGFFTWLIIIVFLLVATYLIFGSWLNYNRYGARGWDLLPHGDTIRDVPYIFQDWLRRVINTLQGPGTRGGYAAV